MVQLGTMILIPIFLAIAAILFGTVFITGVGTLANGTAGDACTNCSTATVTMLDNLELFLVIAGLLSVIGVGIGAIIHKNAK